MPSSQVEVSPLFLTVEGLLSEWARSARTPPLQLFKESLQGDEGSSVRQGHEVRIGLTSFDLAGELG